MVVSGKNTEDRNDFSKWKPKKSWKFSVSLQNDENYQKFSRERLKTWKLHSGKGDEMHFKGVFF